MIAKTCPECGEKFYGRSDKKFCSDYCRNAFNNKQNSDCTNHIRNINNTLRKNRRILENIIVSGKTERLPWQKLALVGFNFEYCTHMRTTNDGKMYFYCYE